MFILPPKIKLCALLILIRSARYARVCLWRNVAVRLKLAAFRDWRSLSPSAYGNIVLVGLKIVRTAG